MGSGSTASLELVVGLKDQASKGLGDIGDKGGFLKNALGFATGGLIEKGIESIGGSLTGFFGDAISESKGWNDAMGQTDAVLKSTGGSAGVTRQQVEDLANSLSANNGLSKFADDAVASGENLLLTFTGIGKDVFPQATQTMLDMSQAMGGDMKGTAIQLGKALNDPAQGLSALTRVGVTFTEQQKEQIKAMVTAGDTAGAQKVMLAELSREFGGSAKAAADAAGPMVQLGAQFDNIKQTVGDALLPILNNLAAAFSQLLTGAMPIITAVVQSLAKGFDFLGSVLKSAQPILTTVFNFLKDNALPVALAIGGIIAGVVVPAFVAWATTMLTVTLPAFLATMAPILVAAAPFIALGAVIAAFAFAAQNNFMGLGDVVSSVISGFQTFFSGLMQALQGDGAGLLSFFNSLGSVFGPIGTFLVNIIANFQAFFATIGQGGDVLGAFATLIGGNFGAVTTLIGGLLEQLGKALPDILAKLGEWGEAFVSWIGPKIPVMLGKLAELAGQLLDWLFNTALPAIIQKLGEWGKAFIDWVGPKIGPLLLELGKLLLKLGEWVVTTALPTVIGKLAEWAKAFIDWVGPQIPPLLLELGKLLFKLGEWVVTTALPTIVTKLVEWGGAFLGWVGKDVLPTLGTKLGEIATKVWNWITNDALPTIVSKLIEWGGAFLGWIAKDVLPTLPTKLGEILTAIGSWVGNASGGAVKWVTDKLVEVGTALVNGIINGLAGLATALYNTLLEEINTAITNVKNFLGIKSPSRLMAVEIGDPIAQGILAGVSQGLRGFGDTLRNYLGGVGGPESSGYHTLGVGIGDPIAQGILVGVQKGLAGGWGRMVREFADKGVGDIPRVGGGNTDYLGGVTSSDYLSNVLSGGASGGSGGGGGSHVQTVGVPGGPNKGGDQFHIIIHAGRGTNGKEIEDAVASGISQTLYQRQSGRRRGF